MSVIPRTFIALCLSPAVQQECEHIQQRFKVLNPGSRIRWTHPADLHLTMVFLGDISEKNRSDITILLQRQSQLYTAPCWQLGRLDAFPDTITPKVIVVRAHAQDTVAVQIRQNLRAALTEKSISTDDTPWVPHVTIARSAQHMPRANFNAAVQPLTWKATRLILMHRPSVHRNGAAYLEIESFSFCSS